MDHGGSFPGHHSSYFKNWKAVGTPKVTMNYEP